MARVRDQGPWRAVLALFQNRGVPATRVLSLDGLDALIGALAAGGRQVVGPSRRGDVVDLDEVQSVTDLPAGLADEQSPGRYRIQATDEPLLFAHTVTATSPRRWLHPPHETLVRIRRVDGSFAVDPRPADDPPLALVGIRPCDVHGIDVADRVARAGGDQRAVARRAATIVVAANCTRADETCFCDSTGTGPEATTGHDLALTEIHDDDGHRFLVDIGTDRGAQLLEGLPSRPATDHDRQAAADGIEQARRQQQRALETEGLHDALLGVLEHPRWDDVADRCLSCGNCTLVCPTCFCTTVEDRTDLLGEWTERSRRWESCFSLDHSHLGEGSVRDTVHHRYRQWLTHKLATWEDQFGESGCVGCGRCITWCPVGIDLTEEVAALRLVPVDR